MQPISAVYNQKRKEIVMHTYEQALSQILTLSALFLGLPLAAGFVNYDLVRLENNKGKVLTSNPSQTVQWQVHPAEGKKKPHPILFYGDRVYVQTQMIHTVGPVRVEAHAMNDKSEALTFFLLPRMGSTRRDPNWSRVG